MLRRLGIIALCAVLSFLVLGVEAQDSTAHADPRIERALDAVTTATFDPQHPADVFPSDFSRVMGYLPATAIGPAGTPILVKPKGDCSSFSGNTDYDFSVVCMEHDLAYDVLRYSALVGRPLPSSSRDVADDMFRRELHANCTYSDWTDIDIGICHFWAESFAIAVDINSWRQGWRPPRIGESIWRWFDCGLLFLVLLVARRELERHENLHGDLVLAGSPR